MYGWMNTYIYSNSNSSIFIHGCIYTYTHIYIHISISIYRRIDKHKTRKYISLSIYPWTNRTPNQSPANTQAHDNGTSIHAKIICG